MGTAFIQYITLPEMLILIWLRFPLTLQIGYWGSFLVLHTWTLTLTVVGDKMKRGEVVFANSSLQFSLAKATSICMFSMLSVKLSYIWSRRAFLIGSNSPANSSECRVVWFSLLDLILIVPKFKRRVNQAKSLIGLISHYKLIWVTGCMIRQMLRYLLLKSIGQITRLKKKKLSPLNS